MVVGRPKQFERNDALAAAMDVFWTKGYEATSVQDLVDAMGVNRGSIYDTFGDKHSLFIEAVEHYLGDHANSLTEKLNAGRTPLAGIQGFFNMVVDGLSCTDCCRGCLITNAAVELAPHDEEVAKVVQRFLKAAEKAFQNHLELAIEEGEIPEDSDARSLARFLLMSLQGLVVMGKASVGKATLKDAVRTTLSALTRG